jgi:hypothetical protein
MNCGGPFVKAEQRQRSCEACLAIPRHLRAVHKRQKSESFKVQYHADPAFKAKLGAKSLEWQNAKYQSDPRFAINSRVRSGILRSIATGSKSRRRWQILVGYDLATLMRHLERQFSPGMTWENRDEWHIDHIVPLASFSFETPDDPDFKAAWALTNLRPLWGPENNKKSAKRLFLL